MLAIRACTHELTCWAFKNARYYGADRRSLLHLVKLPPNKESDLEIGWRRPFSYLHIYHIPIDLEERFFCKGQRTTNTRLHPISDMLLVLFAPFFSRTAKIARGARNPGSKQNQAKNWQDWESADSLSVRSIGGAEIPFRSFPPDSKAASAGDRK